MSNTIYDVMQNIQQPILSINKIPRFTSPYCNIYIRIYSSFFCHVYVVMISDHDSCKTVVCVSLMHSILYLIVE